MSAFSEHTAFDYIELQWQSPGGLLLSSPCRGDGGAGMDVPFLQSESLGCEGAATLKLDLFL